ncbi:beta-1,4 N-acetylgalactosaminyltransferase 1a [Gadus morhua]|uniref:Beta-1,4 N-acetylgalactosaminyltransferase n=1 Tax=Gadus morhua TaxID=8049 RepID=A0A8C4Z181_GADMO|nr:beta-1,4 N-acetylgalactosaminyltransferase 1-like [Gadus morhua]
MRAISKKGLVLVMISGFLLLSLIYLWFPVKKQSVDIGLTQRGHIEKLLMEKNKDTLSSYHDVPYVLKESVSRQLAYGTCECRGDENKINLPLPRILFPRVWANNLNHAYLESDPDPGGVIGRRDKEYSAFQRRSYSPADLLIVAEANSPLQYPTQGVEVRPMKTIIIPGLGLKQDPRPTHTVSLSVTMGTLDVAATVVGVSISGAGQNTMGLSSSVLSQLNRQLQFVTYTNTLFHPKTADTVLYGSGGHKAAFTIKVGHRAIPKLFNSGTNEGYNISALVTIATKTFLRYDKLRDMINSVRKYYPTVLIVIADDNEHPQPVTGPHIDRYIMPFGKGWFAGRNLAVSQVTTKYVLWVDDDFLFTESTKLEKMVDILEKTTLDLVGGAVTEVTGYSATYQHTFSVDEGGSEGDCLHIRQGHYHSIQGFPSCVVADAVINFFMARTDKILRVGFNPQLSRRGHLEFFVDALGSLHVGSCSDVKIGHASKIVLPWSKSESAKSYDRFRYSFTNSEGRMQTEVYYFKNRLKCMSSN